jgi:mRNA degradation ribonuclease J1/J2
MIRSPRCTCQATPVRRAKEVGLANTLDPRFFVPTHGELRHLEQHAKTARALGSPEENSSMSRMGTC